MKALSLNKAVGEGIDATDMQVEGLPIDDGKKLPTVATDEERAKVNKGEPDKHIPNFFSFFNLINHDIPMGPPNLEEEKRKFLDKFNDLEEEKGPLSEDSKMYCAEEIESALDINPLKGHKYDLKFEYNVESK